MIKNCSAIKKSLAQLPYREMVDFSNELGEALHVNAEKIAKNLSSLDNTEISEIVAAEQDILAQCFKRKKVITICPTPNKKLWRVSCPTYEEVVVTNNIRDGISELLDKIVVKEVLSD